MCLAIDDYGALIIATRQADIGKLLFEHSIIEQLLIAAALVQISPLLPLRLWYSSRSFRSFVEPQVFLFASRINNKQLFAQINFLLQLIAINNIRALQIQFCWLFGCCCGCGWLVVSSEPRLGPGLQATVEQAAAIKSECVQCPDQA